MHDDINDSGKIKIVVKEIVQWLRGFIHVFINNVARTKTIMDDEDPMKAFVEKFDANLNRAYYISEVVLSCRPLGFSIIINISNTCALQSEQNIAAYNDSKAGYCGLTLS